MSLFGNWCEHKKGPFGYSQKFAKAVIKRTHCLTSDRRDIWLHWHPLWLHFKTHADLQAPVVPTHLLYISKSLRPSSHVPVSSLYKSKVPCLLLPVFSLFLSLSLLLFSPFCQITLSMSVLFLFLSVQDSSRYLWIFSLMHNQNLSFNHIMEWSCWYFLY